MAQRAHRVRRDESFSSAVVDPSDRGRGGRVVPRDVGGSVVWTHTNTQGWQSEAWKYETDIGELRQTLNWQASSASRAHLYVAELEPDGTPGEPTTNPRVIAATSLLLDRACQPGWLYQAAYNGACVGEFYLYGAKFDGKDEYRIVSTEDVQRAGNSTISVKVDDRKPRTFNPQRELLIRIWWPYPRHPWQATSPVRSQLPVLCNIWKLTALTDSISDSRMRGAGLLLLSNKLEVPGADPSKPKPTVAEVLLDVTSQALKDPDSAAAHVPTILSGDLDASEKVAELIQLGVDFPKLLQSLLDGAIRRFALSSPIPAGIILGESANHWNEFHREDEAVKTAIAPLLNMTAAGLAESWLPVILRAIGIDPYGWTIAVDTTEVEQRPDNSQLALEVHKVGALSDAALRRETGFGEDDAPGAEEQARRAAQQPPQQTPELESDPTGPPPGDGLGGPPAIEASVTPSPAQLEAAARMAAVAALSRMGNRIRGRTHASRRAYHGLPAHTIHSVASREEREAVPVDDWPDGVLETFAVMAEAAGLDAECACNRLRARVGRTFRNGDALAALPIEGDFEQCRDADA